MAATVLFEIKKKRRCPTTKKSPFPLVFHLGCDKSSIVTWQFYHGVLKPDGVEVTSKEDMKNLYHMGYFGKGTLSRSAPRFYGDGEDSDEPRMMSLHRYERHKKLRAEADAGGSPRPAGDSSNIVLVKLESEGEPKESSNDVTVVSATGFDKPVPRILARGKKNLKRARDGSGDGSKDDSAAATTSTLGDVDEKTGTADSSAADDDKSGERAAEKQEASSAATEDDDDDDGPDIYECDSSGERILGVEETAGVASSAKEESADDAGDDIIELDSRTGLEVTRADKDVTTKEEDLADDKGGLAEKNEVTVEDKACTSADSGGNESGNSGNPAREELASESVDSTTDVPEITLVTEDISEPEECDDKTGVHEVDLAAEESGDTAQPSGQTRSKRQKRSGSGEGETTVDSDVEEVELIRENAEAAEDSSSGTEPEYFAAEDPWPITESLQLLFEEAYFLSYGLGCLIVKDGDEDLELLKLWQRLCSLCDNFPARYATYHHFRSKGWVVRSGMKYAADYLLYKDGPPFYHASFSVVVRRVQADTLEEDPDHRLQTWQGLSGLIRVNGNASKTVLLCHVIMPKDADLTTPHCLQSFRIQELLVRRWVVSEEREKRDEAS
ncbi:uncharacterized protein LOC144166618 [Haemaphysalis longicornis]